MAVIGRLGVTALSAIALWVVAGPGRALDLVEPPVLADRVAAGELPPIAERLPENPRVITMDGESRQVGRHGGQWRMLIHRSKDVKMFSVYGYARLVCYTEDLALVPDVAEDVSVEEGRIFTIKLRKGHKWSDGHPFTSEDFRYYWEDVANNEDLSPSGPPRVMLVDGAPPLFELIDETTIRYTWSSPNPFFLPSLASAAPLYIYRPAHYLRQFHERYKSAGAEEKKKSGWRVRNWAAEHNKNDNLYKFDNPDLPTLQPWINTTRPPATRFVGMRNPYYHRVDPEGRQLPYIDEVAMMVADSKLIPAKAGSGEVDLQARSLNFSDYTFLKEGEERHDFDVKLWRTVAGAHLALFPNLNVKDEVWRTLFRDVRFRRALSLGINRHEINQVMYYGLGIEANNTILPQSPLYKEEYAATWARFDTDKANALLDEIGLTERDDDDYRLLPDGRTLEIIVETAGEDTEQADVLELVRDSWGLIGIKLFTKPSQREVFRNRIFSGETQMSIWSGYENGMPTADMSPAEYAPTRQISLQWPRWGQHYETSGSSGEAPDLQPAKTLLDLHYAWVASLDPAERERIWHEILQIHTENVFTIGLVSGVFQPVLISNALRNVPGEAIYNWNPGAHFGIYMPDTFWFDS
jgi:peptide/nickel transport system substrate-binding protein